jgi:hypothetical protein
MRILDSEIIIIMIYRRPITKYLEPYFLLPGPLFSIHPMQNKDKKCD